ncbi:MAG: hypothetical protein APR63_06565 [Desulfuromonas sp. SDB]|nr:MAG: hypothetical protein APR63_06565 [Desulfuromonas sp. SDB]
MIFKPEISSWKIFNIGGKGFMGESWLPPLIVIFALFFFYLEGRGKFRLIYHILLISWHFTITGLFIYGSFSDDAIITFATWGISLSFILVVVPLAVFSIIAVISVIQEIRGCFLIPTFKWNQINWRILGFAAILFPVAFIFFQLGTGFNLMIKIAVMITIIQWILLIDGLGRPDSEKSKEVEYINNQTETD